MRGANGKLFGTLSVALQGRDYRVAYSPPYRGTMVPSIRVQTIVLTVSEDYTYRGQVIPTLVLTQGKRTWLKGLPGYSRL